MAWPACGSWAAAAPAKARAAVRTRVRIINDLLRLEPGVETDDEACVCRPAGRIAQAPWRTSLYPAWFSGALFLRFLRIGFTVCGGPVVPVVMARCELMG